MQVSVHKPTTRRNDAREQRQFLPKGWTAETVDGETVFRSPDRQIETTNIDRVEEAIQSGGQR